VVGSLDVLCPAFLVSAHRQGNRIHRANSVISSEWKERQMVSRGDLRFGVCCKPPTEYLILHGQFYDGTPSLLWQQDYPLAKIHKLLSLTILFQYVRKKWERTFLCHYPDHKTLKCGWIFVYFLQTCSVQPSLSLPIDKGTESIELILLSPVNGKKDRQTVSKGDLRFGVCCKPPTEYLIFFTFSGTGKDFCVWAAKSAHILLGIEFVTF
jgi:hypothetical protein